MHEKLDNPLVFVILVGTAIAAFFKGMQYLGKRIGSQGLTSFYGGSGS